MGLIKSHTETCGTIENARNFPRGAYVYSKQKMQWCSVCQLSYIEALTPDRDIRSVCEENTLPC